MARLTYVYRAEDISYVNIGKRQLPVVAGENLMMLMDLNSKGLSIDCPQIRGRDLETFSRKFNLLDSDELSNSLEIDSAEFLSVLNQCVQCVGCRRSVERLFYQLTLSEHPTLDPLVLKTSCILSIAEEKLKTPQALGTVLYRHHEVLNNLLENKLRNKTRCVLHSLDTFRTKPFSETWREVWSSMKQSCRDELAVIETKELQGVLENYLKKHKFCQGCRTKIEKAYQILVGDTTSKEKGFVAALYANIKKCHPDKHIHVVTNKLDFLDALLRRAEPEINTNFSKQRERHAKTLEIAQEEVLTCVGMVMFERFRRIYISLREEERACQVLAAVGVHALCRSFDMAVEKKQGISNLELLYNEISRAEKAKEHKREQKKLKKKKKKDEKKNYRLCDVNIDNTGSDTADAEDHAVEGYDDEDFIVEKKSIQQNSDNTEVVIPRNEDQFTTAKILSRRDKKIVVKKSNLKQKSQKKNKKRKQQRNILKNNSCSSESYSTYESSSSIVHNGSRGKCVDCQEPSSNCPCEIDICTKSLDAGYASDPNSILNSRNSSAVSTPEGSVMSCSEGFCNHEQANCVSELEHDNGPHPGHHSEQFDDCPTACCYQHYQSLSLLQMLDDFEDFNETGEKCYIPQEVVLQYQYQHDRVQQQRKQLRETLKRNFDRLCKQTKGVSVFNCK